LHSTGQLHKGGANNGLFVQLVSHASRDVPIPGELFSFGVLAAAQALGDLASLQSHRRRVARIELGANPAAALRALARSIGGKTPDMTRTVTGKKAAPRKPTSTGKTMLKKPRNPKAAGRRNRSK
jgi:hypothetical protein